MLWGAEKLVPAEYWCPYGTIYVQTTVHLYWFIIIHIVVNEFNEMYLQLPVATESISTYLWEGPNPKIITSLQKSIHGMLMVVFKHQHFVCRHSCSHICIEVYVDMSLKVLGKSVGLCKTTKRKDQLYISLLLFLYGESSVKISTQTDSY